MWYYIHVVPVLTTDQGKRVSIVDIVIDRVASTCYGINSLPIYFHKSCFVSCSGYFLGFYKTKFYLLLKQLNSRDSIDMVQMNFT